MSLRSPIGRVLGLGAAKEGVSHWWSQRVTSVALLPLALWFVSSLLRMSMLVLGWPLAVMFSRSLYRAFGIRRTLRAGSLMFPVGALLLLLLTGTLVYHSQIGVQVVVEDYVHHHGLKIVTMLLLTFAHIVVAALAIFAVLRLAFGGAG